MRSVIIFFALLVSPGFSGTPNPTNNSPTSKHATEWRLHQMGAQNGIDAPALNKALSQAISLRKQARSDVSWQHMGPFSTAGRTKDVDMDAAGNIYATIASAGLYRADNQGQNWTSILNDAPILSIGDFAIGSNDASILYLGTGEPAGTNAGIAYPGNGIFKSEDGGKTWFNVGLEQTQTFGRIVVDPNNPDLVYAGAMGGLYQNNEHRGLYRSKDGGLHWDKVLYINDRTGIIDLVMHPNNPNQIWAAAWERLRGGENPSWSGTGSGLYYSADGGDSWTRLSTGLPEGPLGRMGITISASSPNILYVIVTGTDNQCQGVYKTEDGGTTWQLTTGTKPQRGNLFDGLGWLYSRILVNPTNPDYLLVSGDWLGRSMDGGLSWTKYREEPGSDIGRGQFGFLFDLAQPERIVMVDDSGVNITDENGWFFRTREGLPNGQALAVDLHPEDQHRLYVAMQHLGAIFTDKTIDDWDLGVIFTGAWVSHDPQFEEYHYSSGGYGVFGRGSARGSDNTGNFTPEDRWSFASPAAVDSIDPGTVYFASNRVYRSEDGITNFVPISDDLSNGPVAGYPHGGTITALTLAPSDNRVLYAGTDDGNLWITRNTGGEWTKISDDLPSRWVTRITVDHDNPDVAYICYSGFNLEDRGAYLYKTTDGGNTWTSHRGNLPEVPIYDLIVDPIDNDLIYAATDLGVFYSLNDGTSWHNLASGLPLLPIMDLAIRRSTRQLAAATYGQGMWMIDLNQAVPVDPHRGTDLPLVQVLPKVVVSETGETQVRLVNNSTQTVSAELHGFAADGSLVGSVPLQPLPAMGAFGGDVGDLFGENATSISWLQVGSDQQITAFAEMREPQTRAAYRAVNQFSERTFLPHVARDTGSFETNVASVNTSSEGLPHSIRHDSQAEASLISEHMGAYAGVDRDLRHYFGMDLSSITFAELDAETPASASMEYFVTLPNRNQMAALDLHGRVSDTIRFLHVAADLESFWTGMIYINTGDVAQTVTEKFYDVAGTLLEERQQSLDAKGKVTLVASKDFASVPQGTSWVEVSGSGDLIGYELFGSANGSGAEVFAGLQGSDSTGTRLIYPYNPDENRWLGLTAVNLGEQTASLSFTAYNANGEIIETTTPTVVAPKTKVVGSARALFSAEKMTDIAWIAAQADGSAWSGFLLWGDLNNSPGLHLSGINATAE